MNGLVAWYQGKVAAKEVWYFAKWPYATLNDVVRYITKYPMPYVKGVIKGKGASYRSIQLLMGKPPVRMTVKMGIDIAIIEGLRLMYIPNPKHEPAQIDSKDVRTETAPSNMSTIMVKRGRKVQPMEAKQTEKSISVLR